MNYMELSIQKCYNKKELIKNSNNVFYYNSREETNLILE